VTFGRISALLGVLFALVVLSVFLFPEMRWFLPLAAAEEAQGIDNLIRLMFVVSMGIWIFVQGFLLYFVWLYRKRPDEPEDAVGRALHGDNRLEIAWTVAPALFLVVLTILSLRVFEDLNLDVPGSGERIVDVLGRQFFWTFEYPATGISEVGVLTLEQGVSTTLNITAPMEDVIHAFWVPEFRVKQDATPGYVRSITITPTVLGEFPIRCAEFCGAGHSQMLGRVQVLDSAGYQAWEQERLAVATPPDVEDPEAMAEFGASVYQANGCGSCHVLPAVDSVGILGPSHAQMGVVAQQRIEDPGYTGSAGTAEDYIRESIREPGIYVVPGYANVMPPYGEDQISEEELEALVQFLMMQE
jgi:cytochrome c oxidase subunit II